MKEHGIDELFEVTRQVPTELSQRQVLEIIKVIPTLPPPGNSWFNINLNSIIMTTTVVAIISAAVIYFTNPTTTPELPGQEPEALNTIQMQEVEQKQDTIQVQSKPIARNSAVPKPIENKPATLTPGPSLNMASSSTPLVDTNNNELEKINKIHDSPSTTTQVASLEKPQPYLPANDQKEVADQVASQTSPVEETSPIPPTVNEYSPDKLLNEVQLRKLKRNLMRKLSQDDIIKSRRQYMTILEYKKSGITVNRQPLSAQQNAYYKGLLNSYGVKPGPERRIVIESKFIMVGDFTEDGFLGSALGRSMNITFDGNKILFHGLLDEEEKSSSNSLEFDLNKPSKEGESNMMFSTQGKVQHSEGNILSAQRLTAEGPFEESLFEDNTYVIGNAVTMTNGDVDVPPVELGSQKINKLKKELYRYLVQDDIVNSNKADVNMVLGTGPFSVNDNNYFSSSLQKRYLQLLQQYGVQLRPKLKILMSPDFIFVGEFGEDNFNGSVRGVLMKEKIVGSIFEKELGKYSLFGQANKISEGVTENRSVKSFDRIKVSGLAVVYYTEGPEKDLRLDVAGMPIEDLKTEVVNGELLIYTTKDKNFNGESIKVYVSSPDIQSIVVEGTAEFFSQNQISVEALKVSAFGAGSIELTVDVERLHLIMDGGDIEVEGKATMERTDFLEDANNGTLEQSRLRVLKNWEPYEKSSNAGDVLANFKKALTKKLIADGFIESWREEVTISFSTTGLVIEKSELAADELASYLSLLKTYDVNLRNERKLFLSRELIVIADRNNGKFEFKMRGTTNLSFNAQSTWQKLEDDIFNRE